MKKRWSMVMLLGMLLLTACAKNEDCLMNEGMEPERVDEGINEAPDVGENSMKEQPERTDDVTDMNENPTVSEQQNRSVDEILDDFIDGKIEGEWNGNKSLKIADLLLPGRSVGDRVDLDNDGENELIINGFYGGYGDFYVDVWNGEVHVLTSYEGTTGELSYAEYEGAVWIVHSDITHAGRQIFRLDQYDGDENIVDSFVLSAKYWDKGVESYDETSDFQYRGEPITMEEYEAKRMEIFGW